MNTNKTNRELLDLAAKAAGYVIDEPARNGSARMWVYLKDAKPNNDKEMPIFMWNPRDDDGDSRRLAVKLNLIVGAYASYVSVGETYDKPKLAAAGAEFICWHYETGGNPDAAARLAVLRAAAAIGEAMP